MELSHYNGLIIIHWAVDATPSAYEFCDFSAAKECFKNKRGAKTVTLFERVNGEMKFREIWEAGQ